MRKKRILFISHIGDTLGHLIRALSIANNIDKSSYDIYFANAKTGIPIIHEYDKSFHTFQINWHFSHNDANENKPEDSYINEIINSNKDLDVLFSFLKPDLIISFPGIITHQLAKKHRIKHISVLHAPYLTNIIHMEKMNNQEKIVFNFLNKFFSEEWIDILFHRITNEMNAPYSSYRNFLDDEIIFIPQSGVDFQKKKNITQFPFIDATFGPRNNILKRNEKVCLCSFGSGNPCDLKGILELLSKRFEKVLYCKGYSKITMLPKNVITTNFINLDSIRYNIEFGIVHGGIGSVGFLLKNHIKHMLIPTEPDQIIMALLSNRNSFSESYGLDQWIKKPSLGRKLPKINLSKFEKVLDILINGKKKYNTYPVNGEICIAKAIQDI